MVIYPPILDLRDLAVTGVLLAGVLLLLNRSLRDLVSLRDSFSSKSPKTTEARTSPITELVPHRSALTLSAIVSSRPIDSPQRDVHVTVLLVSPGIWIQLIYLTHGIRTSADVSLNHLNESERFVRVSCWMLTSTGVG
ncbi:hypothetical protein YC2023_117849 [Brassica napus]